MHLMIRIKVSQLSRGHYYYSAIRLKTENSKLYEQSPFADNGILYSVLSHADPNSSRFQARSLKLRRFTSLMTFEDDYLPLPFNLGNQT